MKKLLVVVAAFSCLVLKADAFALEGGGPSVGFAISASPTDPYVNATGFVPGLLSAHLWLYCCLFPPGFPQGISGAEFGVMSTNPSNVILDFTPVGAWLNAGSATNLFLAVGGCPCVFSLAGSWLVLANAPGSLCIGPSLSGTKAGVDCLPNPNLWPVVWIGLDFGGGFCGKGEYCGCCISVEESSWGSVKSLYR